MCLISTYIVRKPSLKEVITFEKDKEQAKIENKKGSLFFK